MDWEKVTIPSHYIWSYSKDEETGGIIAVANLSKIISKARQDLLKELRGEVEGMEEHESDWQDGLIIKVDVIKLLERKV